MASLEDKLLGEKREYYCSSSEGEEEDLKDQPPIPTRSQGGSRNVSTLPLNTAQPNNNNYTHALAGAPHTAYRLITTNPGFQLQRT